MLLYTKPIRVRKDKTLGYEYFLDRDHPLSNKYGRVYYHRHVASLKLGRWLQPTEIVHHKDGDRSNNKKGNIQILRSQAEHNHKHRPPRKKIKCGCCSKFFRPWHGKSKYCSLGCSSKIRRRFRITKSKLQRLIWSMPTTEVAKKLGVSDVAIAKRCKMLEIEKPPRGYWSSERSRG